MITVGTAAQAAYIVAALLFILALAGLSRHESAKLEFAENRDHERGQQALVRVSPA